MFDYDNIKIYIFLGGVALLIHIIFVAFLLVKKRLGIWGLEHETRSIPASDALADKEARKSVDPAWAAVSKEIEGRYSALHRIISYRTELNEKGNEQEKIKHTIALAAADLFIEKAQIYLKRNIRHMYIMAVLSLCSCALMIGLGLYSVKLGSIAQVIEVLDDQSPMHDIKNTQSPILDSSNIQEKSEAISNYKEYRVNILKDGAFERKRELIDLNIYHFFLLFIRAIGFMFLISISIYISVSFAKAFFHEATILNHRQHALRFGRLFLYMKYGDLDGRDQDKGLVDELSQTFGWNYITDTAFKGLDFGGVPKNLYNTLIEAAVDVIKEVSKRKIADNNDKTEEKKIST